MRIILTGGTGTIGKALVGALIAAGDEVIVLSRNPSAHTFPHGVIALAWDAQSGAGWQDRITRDTAIINLAGEPIAAPRWTDAHKQRVIASRLNAAAAMRDAITIASAEDRAPKVLLQANAVGYFGDRGEAVLTDDSARGDDRDWRVRVCDQWQQATADLSVRQVILRIGIVMSTHGGAYPPMLLGARFMTRQLGTGQQFVPWIHNADCAGAIAFLAHHDHAHGAVNVCAPEPARNRDLIGAIAQSLGMPSLIPIPTPFLRIGTGEQAGAVLDSQRVIPEKLMAWGYRFQFADVTAAMQDLRRAAV
jgi:uncharacterized protein